MTERRARQINPRLTELRARFDIEEQFPHPDAFDLEFVATALVDSITEGDLDSLRFIRKASIMWQRTSDQKLKGELIAIQQISGIVCDRGS